MTTTVASTGAPGSIERDAAYAKALAFVQEARWAEAADALAELEQCYPGSSEVAALQQRLALQLSAEETWSAERASRLPRHLRPLGVRILLLANLVVYLLLIVGWLVGGWLGLQSQANWP